MFFSRILSTASLSHIKIFLSPVYYDARILVPHLDAIHVFAFDETNPERSPKKADYPAPIYESYGREAYDNVDAQTR